MVAEASTQSELVDRLAHQGLVPLSLLYAVFWVSGFASLLYQVIWQRALFTIFGTNIESVTVVVTAFMLGLGIGSLLGGRLSRDASRPVLPLFSCIELAIGAYGLCSLALFALVGTWLGPESALAIGLVSFGLVLFPTLLMGATLPLLVAHVVRRSGHVGRSVSWLYFVNTLGAAAGALLASLFLLGKLGLQGSTQLAAVLNLAVGISVLGAWWWFRERTP